MSCLYKGKNVYCPSLIPSPYDAFLYFLEGQVHKYSKFKIMTNVGKNRLLKVIFTNIRKISDARASSFSRYIMIAQCMRIMFLLFIKFNFLWKNSVSEKIKAHLPSPPPLPPSITSVVHPPPF